MVLKMVGFWPFKKKSPVSLSEEYEKQLEELTDKIEKIDLKIIRLRISQRRVTGLFSFYTIFLYIIFASISVAFALKKREKHASNEAFITLFTWHKLGSLIIIPFLIFYIRKGISFFFNRRLKSEISLMESYKKDKKLRIDEFKSKINFYSTKNLLERFDDSKPKPISKTIETSKTRSNRNFNKNANPNIANKNIAVSNNMPNSKSKDSNNVNPQINSNLINSPNGYLANNKIPLERHWYDRVLDLLIGEDENSSSSRYALICWSCNSHNGLAPPGTTPNKVKYVCPYCHALNPHESDGNKSLTNKTEDFNEKKINGEINKEVNGSADEIMLSLNNVSNKKVSDELTKKAEESSTSADHMEKPDKSKKSKNLDLARHDKNSNQKS